MMRSDWLLFLWLSAVGAVLGSPFKNVEWTVSDYVKFQLRSCDRSRGPYVASVPGSVHTDLMANNVIPADPYFRYEEKNLSWIALECWEYESSPFSLPVDFDLTSDVRIRFAQLDAVADVFLNGQRIGVTRNAHRSHDILIPSFFWSPQREKSYVLTIRLSSALQYAHTQAADYPYVVPETQNYNVWAEPSDRNFLRKAGSDFGWDWGPAFVNTGIGGNITFLQHSVAKIDGLVIQEKFLDKSLTKVVVDISVVLSMVSPSTVVTDVEIQLDEVTVRRTRVTLTQCDKKTCVVNVGSVSIPSPQLWWPIGYGNQKLYAIQVRMLDQIITRKIGLRTVELIQEPVWSASNTSNEVSFFIKINNRAIFMRGANFIPIDSFHNRVQHADRAYILHTAVQSNMNMLRVWGGGIYQPDDFYEMADALGIMIWQEIMLACALYPRNEAFLHEVHEEVVSQAIRLNTHPSIVVWGGNNENEVALQWFESSRNNRDLYVSDYSALYGGTVYPALISVLGASTLKHSVIWVDSSPSNGLVSTDPYAKIWGSASTASQGDVHFYDYSCDCEDFQSFPKAKFVSEFGFQTMPSFQTYESVLIAEDYDSRANSAVLQYRQRHEDGNTQMEEQLAKHFALPAECADTQRSFDMYLYVIGLQQSRCYETAMNRWRQLRGFDSSSLDDQHTMGILYWQLNDIWQGPSWASTEYSGRWKPLQYVARRVFEMVSLSVSYAPQRLGSTRDTSPSAEVFLVNDHLTDAVHMRVTAELKSWSTAESTVLWAEDLLVPAEASVRVITLSLQSSDLAAANCDLSTCYLKTTAKRIASSPRDDGIDSELRQITALTAIKHAQLELNTAVSFADFAQVSDHEVSFSVTSNATSPFFFLELINSNVPPKAATTTDGVFQRYAGWFSDNNFVAEKGVQYDLSYVSFVDKLDVAAFRSMLRGRSLQHAYQCDLPVFAP